MSEMVERVARALMAVTSTHDCGDLKLKHHYEMARAAMEAMREPTEEMMVDAEVKAPALACFYEKERSPSYLAWQAMIDAALKP